MILYILISLFVILLLWILLGPVIIFMDTDRNRYLLTLPGIISAKLVTAGDQFYFRVWIFFIPVRIDPLKMRKEKKPREEKPEKKRRKSKKTFGLRMIREALRAIRIRRLMLDIDTEDFQLNSWLIPVFSGVNSEKIHMQVNYAGNSSLHLDLRTRISSLLWLLYKTR